MKKRGRPCEWRTVPLFEFLEANRIGQVRRKFADSKGRFNNLIYSQHKKSGSRNGKLGAPYFLISTCEKGKIIWLRVHRLICLAFHGIPENIGRYAAHRDGNSLNNKARNLYWATPAQNVADAKRHGTFIFGSKSKGALLNEKKVAKIKTLLRDGVSQIKIANRYGVSDRVIWHIKNGNSWRHVR